MSTTLEAVRPEGDLDEFVDGLLAEVRRRYWKLEHPLAKRIVAGEMARDDLLVWGSQFYRVTIDVADCIGFMIDAAPDLETKRSLVDNLAEEFGENSPDEAHQNLLLQTLVSCGIDREQVRSYGYLPGTRGLVAIARHLTQRSFVAGLVALPIVGELYGPESSVAYRDAFRDHYDAADTIYFDTHIEADEGHGETGRRLLRELALDEARRPEIVEAAAWALDGWWGLYDSILNEIRG